MATNQIEMQYDLRQNSSENSRVYGLWFPRAVRHSTLNLKGLAQHIQGHGSIYTNDVVSGVLTKFKDCLVELVSQGTAVKIDGLGTFYPTIEASGAENAVGYNLAEHIEGVHVRFLPENTKDEKITSKAFAQKVSMKQRLIFDMYGVPKKVKSGQLVDYGEDDDNNNENGEG